MSIVNKPGVLILGGDANTVSVVRSFGRKKIDTFVSVNANCPALRSRYCTQKFPIPVGADHTKFWTELLLTGKNSHLHGTVIFAGSDEAVKFVAENNEALKQNYILDDSIPDLQLAMLDKQATIVSGKGAGCAIPEFWNIETIEDVVKIQDKVLYPAMIKPIHSHLFQRKFEWKKYFLAKNKEDLLRKSREVMQKGLQFMVCEFIPGPDSLLSSYHTYIDEKGDHLFHYTHKIIRRFPKNSGGVCMNVTEWLPETAEMGKRFFDGIGFRGMAHIEFKRDLRDGKLKIIECNPRFSAAQSIAAKSGLDMPFLIYSKLTGLPVPENPAYKEGVTRWIPFSDIFAFRELHRLQELTFTDWLRSFLKLPLVFPYFDITDPLPSIKANKIFISEMFSQHLPTSKFLKSVGLTH